MPTQITQRESDGRTVLSVEGEMMLEDALLIERIAGEMHADSGKPITIDLADLDFLDSESAAVLRRLASRDPFRIEGVEIFLQSAIDSVERGG